MSRRIIEKSVYQHWFMHVLSPANRKNSTYQSVHNTSQLVNFLELTSGSLLHPHPTPPMLRCRVWKNVAVALRLDIYVFSESRLSGQCKVQPGILFWQNNYQSLFVLQIQAISVSIENCKTKFSHSYESKSCGSRLGRGHTMAFCYDEPSNVIYDVDVAKGTLSAQFRYSALRIHRFGSFWNTVVVWQIVLLGNFCSSQTENSHGRLSKREKNN
jgi:hypothetical protein